MLEDEAQDSSRLQQDLLELLTGPNGNWVRVGDSNQAVYNTFTTADPRLLNEFLQRDGVAAVEMYESGRSGRPIQVLANHLVDWAVSRTDMRGAATAFRHQVISPTPADDPQPNPPEADCSIAFFAKALLQGFLLGCQFGYLVYGPSLFNRNIDQGLRVMFHHLLEFRKGFSFPQHDG